MTRCDRTEARQRQRELVLRDHVSPPRPRFVVPQRGGYVQKQARGGAARRDAGRYCRQQRVRFQAADCKRRV
eukprot:CAMPEP_0194291706 /NCGR_PEP_ID=MMETSP0169-20130528/43981_1 /TAXON_ID=218684 /ORGANISM="Corethron pennatum, Strain L29A3" /LENGTH=71 /DNA_ID=CAMNT_0039039675 /DNA_START=6 /DNA_END=218 /DNA_ORIENTATION=-